MFHRDTYSTQQNILPKQTPLPKNFACKQQPQSSTTTFSVSNNGSSLWYRTFCAPLRHDALYPPFHFPPASYPYSLGYYPRLCSLTLQPNPISPSLNPSILSSRKPPTPSTPPPQPQPATPKQGFDVLTCQPFFTSCGVGNLLIP